MELFMTNKLKLKIDVKKGDQENLLALFSAGERFKPAQIHIDARENETVKVSLEELGDIDLKLGDDMEKGQKKTIMTLFWFEERSKPITIMKEARAEDTVVVNVYKLDG